MKFTHPKLGVLSLTKVNNNHCTVSLKTTTLTQTAFPCQSGATRAPATFSSQSVSQSVSLSFPSWGQSVPVTDQTRASDCFLQQTSRPLTVRSLPGQSRKFQSSCFPSSFPRLPWGAAQPGGTFIEIVIKTLQPVTTCCNQPLLTSTLCLISDPFVLFLLSVNPRALH